MKNIKQTWSAQNFPLIVMIGLYVAVFFNINPIELPQEVMAYQKEEIETVDITTLIEQRTDAIQQSMRREAKFRAIKEVYDELGVIVDAEQESRLMETK